MRSDYPLNSLQWDAPLLSETAKARMTAWAAALETGEHEQGTGLLEYQETEDGPVRRCCLGVLCRVAMADGLNITTDNEPFSNLPKKATSFNAQCSTAPMEVIDWLLDNNSEIYFDQEIFIKMNDDLGYDFAQIASAIRTRYGLGQEVAGGSEAA